MSTVKKSAEIAELKIQALAYYSKMPVKKYAAYYVGRDEDTFLRWEKEDADFADKVKQLKSEYLLAKSKGLRPEFIVPLLFRELTPRQELTGKDGSDLSIKLVKYGDNDTK
jgi:hypothetical protein